MKKDSTNDILVADAILRLQAMQNIFVRKGLFTNEELKAEINVVSSAIMKSILEKAHVQGDLDQLVSNITSAANIDK
jgi:hypothetical protein